MRKVGDVLMSKRYNPVADRCMVRVPVTVGRMLQGLSRVFVAGQMFLLIVTLLTGAVGMLGDFLQFRRPLMIFVV